MVVVVVVVVAMVVQIQHSLHCKLITSVVMQR